MSDLLPGTTYPMALDFADPRHGWLACLDDATGLPSLLATSDGGDTWQMAAGSGAFDGEYISAIEFVGPLEGWAAGESLFHTTDGGATWTRQVSGVTRQLTTIAAVDAAHVWAGGAGLISTVDAAGDVATPVTLSDVRGGWTRKAVAIHLTAADVGDSRPVSTEYRVDDGPWTAGLIPPRFSAPSDHSGDGMHTVEYRSTDAAGNVEPVQSVAVNIDTVRPVVRLGRCTIGSDGVLRLQDAHRRHQLPFGRLAGVRGHQHEGRRLRLSIVRGDAGGDEPLADVRGRRVAVPACRQVPHLVARA